MASMTEITCKCGCGRKKMVRTADVKRGWGKFFSKSCKAKYQERRTGQYKNYLKSKPVQTEDGIIVGSDFRGITDQEHDQIMNDLEAGWDGRKDTF